MQDIRRIAFVSERYLELQGFGPALLGAGMILGALLVHLTGTVSSSAPVLPLMFGGMLGGQTAPYLQRSYGRSFGTAVGTRSQQFAATMSQWLVMMGALADIGIQFNGRFAPSFAAIALAASSSMIVARDGRWRVHHLAGVVAGMTGAIVTSVVPHAIDRWGGIGPARAEAYVLAYTIVGLGLIAVGVLDHHLLASFMRPAASANAARAAEAAPARIPKRSAVAMLFCVLVGGFAGAVGARTVALALPALLIVSALIAQFGASIADVRRAARAIVRCERPPILNAVDLDVSADVLGAFFVLAAAAAIDSALFPQRAPDALTTALVVTGGSLVARDWARRGHYAIVVLAALLTAVLTRHLTPAHALSFLIAAVSGGLAIAWTLGPPHALIPKPNSEATPAPSPCPDS